MQIKSKYSWMKHIDFMIVDLIALFISFWVSFHLKFDKWDFYQNEEWTRYLFIVLALSLVINFFSNPYSGILKRSYYMEIIRAFQLAFYNLLFATTIFYAFKIGATYSREMSFVMYGIYFVLSMVLKYIWKKLLVSGKVVLTTTRKIPLFVIAGKDDIKKNIQNVMAGDFRLYDIQGVHLIDAERESVFVEGFGTFPVYSQGYDQFILDSNIDEVLVAVTPGKVEPGILERLNANAVGLNMVIESAVGFQPEDQYIQNFGVYKSLSIGAFTFTPSQMLYLGVKRLIDILCGILGLIVLVPVALIVKVLYLITGDREKIFYRQSRIGENGKEIRIWKFRSMVPNADAELEKLLKDPKYKEEWDQSQKLSNDPRITRIGRILRKTSIDELPQLLNVLKGDMSLVGPRPLVSGELEKFGGLKLYQKVKPGITGWWACNGRSNIDYRERLELEYYYVRNCSLYLDLLCLFRTVLAVIKKDGAQ